MYGSPIQSAQQNRHSTANVSDQIHEGENSDDLAGEPVPKRTRAYFLNKTFVIGPVATTVAASSESDFTADYRLILSYFINSNDKQFACPSHLTKEQRAIVHKLATEVNLKHESKGN